MSSPLSKDKTSVNTFFGNFSLLLYRINERKQLFIESQLKKDATKFCKYL